MPRPILSAAILLFVSSPGLAQPDVVPLHNWTVPPYASGSSGGITTMTDATPPRLFIGVQPCRLVDTRAGSGFPAGFGAPALAPGAPRSFDLDSGPCPGLPAGIVAYSLNVTVVGPSGPGHLVIYPQGGSQPVVSSINYVAGQTLANAVIVPAGPTGGVTVVAGVSGTNLLIDINGYFSENLGNPQNSFELVTSTIEYAAYVLNVNPTCQGRCGLLAEVLSNSDNSIAIAGITLSDVGRHYGVRGRVSDINSGSAGVLGEDAGGATIPDLFSSAGVRGESDSGGTGVLGVVAHPGGEGVTGFFLDADTGAVLSGAHLGYSANTGVNFINGLAGSGTKSFIEPHPTDAAKLIRYVSLEGREAGTYFRGRGKFQNGIAVIEVPEDFRMVTDPEGLSIQVTPIGQMAAVAVESIGLARIVVRGSRNVEFFYTVNGERRAYKNIPVVVENQKFLVPESARARMPQWLSEDERQRLVTNGTYNADGTVNMETARRLGWERIWQERKRLAAAPD